MLILRPALLLAFGTALLLCWPGVSPAAAQAAEPASKVRARGLPGGIIEFSNKGPSQRRPPTRRNTSKLSGGSRAFWYRARNDGVIEFTNLHPVGRRWKVLFKTGPGKAAALRGDTDRVPARDRSPARFSRFDAHIYDQQAYYGIPPALLRAVIQTESDYDPRVVSSVGAQGLMQLMPKTARAMGVVDAFDPRQNIMGGSRYLQLLARRYCRTPTPPGQWPAAVTTCGAQELATVIAAYHAGPGTVAKYGGMPPYQTTRAYVATVLARFDRYLAIETGANP